MRAKLMNQMLDLFRAIPHRPECPRFIAGVHKGNRVNVSCDCVVGDNMKIPSVLMMKLVKDALSAHPEAEPV